MNHVLTSHTMQMIYDPQCIKVLKLKIKEGQRRDLLFQKKHSWIYILLRLGKIIDSLFPTVTFEKVQPWKWCRYVFISGNVFWFMQILVHAKNCLHKVKIGIQITGILGIKTCAIPFDLESLAYKNTFEL